jgi:hypothetical protein
VAPGPLPRRDARTGRDRAEIQGRRSNGDVTDQDATLRIVDVEAPYRLVWEGGSLDAILSRHSFVLNPRPDGTTEFTDSEEFFGPVAAELIPILGRVRTESSQYGAALQARVEALSGRRSQACRD